MNLQRNSWIESFFFVVFSGQQLYSRNNNSLKNVHHHVFSGHMQVRQRPLSAVPGITLKAEQRPGVSLWYSPAQLHRVGDSFSTVCMAKPNDAPTGNQWGGDVWLQKWDPSCYLLYLLVAQLQLMDSRLKGCWVLWQCEHAWCAVCGCLDRHLSNSMLRSFHLHLFILISQFGRFDFTITLFSRKQGSSMNI